MTYIVLVDRTRVGEGTIAGDIYEMHAINNSVVFKKKNSLLLHPPIVEY